MSDKDTKEKSSMTTDKRLDESKVSTNRQMQLFSLPTVIDKNYSNLIDIYDALDKYSYGRGKRGKRVRSIADSIRNTVTYLNKRKILATVRAANITDKKGNPVLVFPGEREERVEEALRKLAVEGRGVFIDGSAGVTFTLYGLQKELKSRGHTYSIDELKEAILINRRATLEVSTEDGSALVDSGFFEAVGLVTKKEYQKDAKAHCYVRFNPLVTESIVRLTYRRYDYARSMKITSPLALYLFKRMSLYFTQAGINTPYTPNLVSFLSQSPRGLSVRMGDNVRAMTNALEALIKQKVVATYEFERVKESRKIIDIRYKIYPHEQFVQQQCSGNKVKNDTQTKLNGISFSSTAEGVLFY